MSTWMKPCHSPVTQTSGQRLLKGSWRSGTFRIVAEHWMESMSPVNARQEVDPPISTIKSFIRWCFWPLWTMTINFLWVDIGGRGAESDAQVWNVSDLQEGVVTGDVELPADGPLPYNNQDVPYFFIGDDAFALRKYMMKPYGHRQLSHDERIFNYRLSRARRVVENAFGILANRFQVMLTTMQHKPGTVRLIVTACIILHNLMRIRYPRLQNNMIDGEDENHDLVPGAWRQGRNMRDVQVVKGPNRDTREGKRLRNLIKHWCNSKAGSVPWQEDKI
ncbi:hypothetical protein HOLleu_40981 [Holothuria leucospilota]|uniref:DDE Tnp4 domain-containing protein n=1 Tax=Holothuria leucospilota TaxID=206669 RepID=A0A9Q1BAX7_HOLLE|nr:hypothetical protein HOLleu_40981 [Holothuria leucospilota]